MFIHDDWRWAFQFHMWCGSIVVTFAVELDVDKFGLWDICDSPREKVWFVLQFTLMSVISVALVLTFARIESMYIYIYMYKGFTYLYMYTCVWFGLDMYVYVSLCDDIHRGCLRCFPLFCVCRYGPFDQGVLILLFLLLVCCVPWVWLDSKVVVVVVVVVVVGVVGCCCCCWVL